jgi:hypothetical protein
MALDQSRKSSSPYLQGEAPVTATEILCREPFGSGGCVDYVVDPRQWLTVFPCRIIQLYIVHAKEMGPIFLPEEDDRR